MVERAGVRVVVDEVCDSAGDTHRIAEVFRVWPLRTSILLGGSVSQARASQGRLGERPRCQRWSAVAAVLRARCNRLERAQRYDDGTATGRETVLQKGGARQCGYKWCYGWKSRPRRSTRWANSKKAASQAADCEG